MIRWKSYQLPLKSVEKHGMGPGDGVVYELLPIGATDEDIRNDIPHAAALFAASVYMGEPNERWCAAVVEARLFLENAQLPSEWRYYVEKAHGQWDRWSFTEELT